MNKMDGPRVLGDPNINSQFKNEKNAVVFGRND